MRLDTALAAVVMNLSVVGCAAIEPKPLNVKLPAAATIDGVMVQITGATRNHSGYGSVASFNGLAVNTTKADLALVSIHFDMLFEDLKVGDLVASSSGLTAGQAWSFTAYPTATSVFDAVGNPRVTAIPKAATSMLGPPPTTFDPPRTPRTVPFDQAEYAALPTSGTGRLDGEAFVRLLNGQTRPAAGLPVTASPVTRYSREGFEIFSRDALPEDADARVRPYSRQVTADSAGRFHFEGMPPGRWYVVTGIWWPLADVQARTWSWTGHWLAAEVEVKNDEAATVVLTR